MTDPLAQVVNLLQLRAGQSKLSHGAGAFLLKRTQTEGPFYAAILEGACRLTVHGQAITLEKGDFVLIPAAYDFAISSTKGRAAPGAPTQLGPGEFRLGRLEGEPDVSMLVGHCTFASRDASLLVPLLPKLVHVRGVSRLTTLVQLVREESRARLPAREVILERLLEVLFIEALRSQAQSASPGLLRGLSDERLAIALRCMHEQPTHGWTVATLAKEAALSRSAFFERFKRAVGVAPMAYLLQWRMALAKDLLGQRASVGEVAERVGYSSASTFSVAFARHVGVPPSAFARQT